MAVDLDPDPTSNPSGGLLAPGARSADAAPPQRGFGSGVRVRDDREHIWRSDFLGIGESHSLSWRNIFRDNIVAHFFNREAEP